MFCSLFSPPRWGLPLSSSPHFLCNYPAFHCFLNTLPRHFGAFLRQITPQVVQLFWAEWLLHLLYEDNYLSGCVNCCFTLVLLTCVENMVELQNSINRTCSLWCFSSIKSCSLSSLHHYNCSSFFSPFSLLLSTVSYSQSALQGNLTDMCKGHTHFSPKIILTSISPRLAHMWGHRSNPQAWSHLISAGSHSSDWLEFISPPLFSICYSLICMFPLMFAGSGWLPSSARAPTGGSRLCLCWR